MVERNPRAITRGLLEALERRSGREPVAERMDRQS